MGDCPYPAVGCYSTTMRKENEGVYEEVEVEIEGYRAWKHVTIIKLQILILISDHMIKKSSYIHLS
jgi:hypothetical protein